MINKVGAKQELPVVLNDTVYLKPDTVWVERYDTVFTNKVDTIYPRKETKEERFERLAMQNDANRIVSNMYKAIDGLGTDDALFEKTLSEINESNVYYVNDIWDKTFGKHYGETFYESFMNDADSKQKATFSEKLKALFKKFLHQEK